MPIGPLSAVPKEHIERRDADTLSHEEFIEKYEKVLQSWWCPKDQLTDPRLA